MEHDEIKAYDVLGVIYIKWIGHLSIKECNLFVYLV
jgi:hypothetical protein